MGELGHTECVRALGCGDSPTANHWQEHQNRAARPGASGQVTAAAVLKDKLLKGNLLTLEKTVCLDC